jgi:dephospho-CoA kinase
MKTLGLTGGIGMGKSTAAEWLRQRGIPVVDSDALARQIVEPGQPALAEIQAAFGVEILDSDGSLRREALADIVFQNPASLRQLEAITHPRIRELWRAQLQDWRAAGHACAVAAVPLLFEVQAEADFDATVCVACSASAQRQRLAARGWSAEEIERRVRAQWPIEKKMSAADFVAWTEGGVEVLTAQLESILAKL